MLFEFPTPSRYLTKFETQEMRVGNIEDSKENSDPFSRI